MNSVGMSKLNVSSRILLVTSSVAAAFFAFWMWKKRKRNEPISSEFEKVGKITKLILYPVKSLPGIEVPSAECTKYGLKFGPFRDRQWLIITKNGNFIHQRLEPSLALTSPSFHDNELWINAPGMETLKVPLKKSVAKTDSVIDCRVWGANINGIDCGDRAADWLNAYLKRDDLRFVQYVDDFKPRAMKRNLTYFFSNPGVILYHDDGCVHIVSEKSLEDLNDRLQEKITHRNFRPGVLVTGTTPYAEDNWKFVKTGTATLMFLNPCGRCIMTTVNPDTGEKTEKEPLVTLRTYRMPTLPEDKKKLGQAPMFGIYMGSYENGVVRQGDDIYAVTCLRK